MVKINESQEQPAREVRERVARNWRYSHRPPALPREPKTLCELEQLVKKQIRLMQKFSQTNENDELKIMDLLRLQYNLNFLIVCEKCGGTHNSDELVAPER
ncbi:hypothetical protein HF086_005768 [Spodoptera exigua]|uniref:Uncharacterized protein n=1 Tax=Spodoptera exigua TaxID=7107 RepID=A0A922MS23_SPOEX|nr:hypothetical protein HF086_005768 [Spodoptera exigua]